MSVLKPLSPRDLVYGIRRASEAAISPDGTRGLCCISSADPELGEIRELSLIDLESAKVVRVGATDRNQSGASWSPDGHLIAFKETTSDSESLMVVEADPPGERAQGRSTSLFEGEGIDAIAWSPDQKLLAFTAAFDPDGVDRGDQLADRPRATDRIDYKWDEAGWLGNKRSHVYFVPVDGQDASRLTNELHEHSRPAWSPSGRLLATSVFDWATESFRLLIVDLEGNVQRTIGGDGWVIRGWSWSPTGERLLVAGNDHRTFHSEFFIYDLASDAIRPTTEGLEVFVDDASQPVWMDEATALFAGARRGHSGLFKLLIDHGEVETVAVWPATHTGLSVDGKRRVALQIMQDTRHAGDLALTSLRTGVTRGITDFNAELFESHLVPDTHGVSALSGGREIDGWLIHDPRLEAGERYPLVLWVHGGPEWHIGPRWEDDWQCLATHGYVVLAVNPRGSTSYGEAFLDAVLGDWGPGPFADVEAVLRRAAELPFVDPDRVGIMGASYGAYMTGWATGHTDRFRAAVTKSVTFDLASQYLTADFDQAYGDRAWGGPPYENVKQFRLQSPSTYASEITTPTLILQGEADETTPLNQAEQLFRTLKKTGCTARFVRYPGGWHGFHRSGLPQHREDVLNRTLDWFDRYLRDDSNLRRRNQGQS